MPFLTLLMSRNRDCKEKNRNALFGVYLNFVKTYRDHLEFEQNQQRLVLSVEVVRRTKVDT